MIPIRLIRPVHKPRRESQHSGRGFLLCSYPAGSVSELKPSETNASAAGVLCRRSLSVSTPANTVAFRSHSLRDERERKAQSRFVSPAVFPRSLTTPVRPCGSTLTQPVVELLRQWTA
jgi:hypothetical protein